MLKKLVLNCGSNEMNDLKFFENRVKKAAAIGFTHVEISALVDRSRWCLDDPEDPWLQWNLSNSTFFKRIVPEDLKDFVPAQTAKENMDLLIEKSKILQKYGLNGVYTSWDPTWLPESFFKKHPDWRGPRVDHPRRSRHYRFASCMDHPGVLKLYRDTVKELVTQAPAIDTFMIYANDSGSGMCWSDYLYNNKNGPAACMEIGIGDRVSKFLGELRNGAGDAGINAEVIMCSQFSSTEVNAILACLKPGTGLMDWNGTVASDQEKYKRTEVGSTFIPVLNLPHHYQLANSLRRHNNTAQLVVGLSATQENVFDDYLDMVKFLKDRGSFNIIDRDEKIKELATKSVGKEMAPKLMEVWDYIDKALSLFSYPSCGMSLFEIATVMERWLTRPLVPFPLELTHEEKDYYRKYQFQSNSEETAADMMNCLDAYYVDSRVGANFLDTVYEDGIGYLNSARGLIKAIISEIKDKAKIEELEVVDFSIRALVCIAINSINVCYFQTILYSFPEPEDGVEEGFHQMGDRTREELYNCYRSEIDNTRELIGLLKQSPKPIIKMVDKKEDEDTFNFGPDLADQLQKKIDIMMAHWLDFDRIFPRPNR